MTIAPATLALICAVLWIACVAAAVVLAGMVLFAIGCAVCVALAGWAFLKLIEGWFR